jgi:hypothetical protein
MSISDFVSIQLSAAGIEFAGPGKVVQVSNGHFSYKLSPGESVRVLTSEWRKALMRETWMGEPIFEVVPEIVSQAVPEEASDGKRSVAAADAAKGEEVSDAQ